MPKVLPSSNADGEEPKTPDHQRKPVLDVVCRTCKRTTAIVLNAMHFAMGFAWLGFGKVATTRSFSVDPTTANAGELWACAVVAAVVILPLTGLLIELRSRRECLGKKAKLQNDTEVALKYHAQARAFRTLASWGCAFTLAAQIDNAVSASLPLSPWGWRLLYTCLLVATILAIVIVVVSLGGKCCGDERHGAIVDTIVSGAGYTVALAFLETTVAIFELDDITKTENLKFLAVFTFATIMCTTVTLALLGCLDRIAVKHAISTLIAETISPADEEEAMARVLKTLGVSLRKLLAATMSMCAVVVSYALVYVALIQADIFGDRNGDSVYDPLPVGGAFIFALCALAATVVGGFILEWCLDGLVERLRLLDKDGSQNSFEHTLVMSLDALAQTTAASVKTALAWVFGTALHVFVASVWCEAVKQMEEAPDNAAQIALAFVYAVLMTFATTVVTFCWDAPSLHGA